jgi:hypothetical protein
VVRNFAVIVVLGVLIVSCQPSNDADPSGGVERVVVATSDGSIVIHAADGEELVRADPPPGSVFRQPTWLDGSAIVYSEVSASGAHALIAADAATGAVVWRATSDTAPFYYSPAPAGSPFATTSLRNNPSGNGLIAELIDRNGSVKQVSNDAPFYTAWRPDGGQLAIHITGDRLDVDDGAEVHTILSPTGLFQAPAWTDHGLVALSTARDTQTLAVWNGDEFADLATLDGAAAFVGSGDRVAVQASQLSDPNAVQVVLRVQEMPALASGKLLVVNLGTAAVETVADSRSFLYQWDQSGERLLYGLPTEDAAALVWFVWADGSSLEVAEFSPQLDWFGSFVPFFDQYAQSVSMWSPSGDRVAYPAVRDGEPAVIVSPIVGEGEIVIPDAVWASWEPTPR